MTRYKIGVDIGGTFTDLVVYDQAEGNVYTQKALTTPHDLSEGVMQCIEQYVTDFNEIDYFVHGTTSGL
ncbi:MAG: hydantoinase/oxoprolinase N-terminal domain-containing protein, partial [Bhargavaea sp.]